MADKNTSLNPFRHSHCVIYRVGDTPDSFSWHRTVAMSRLEASILFNAMEQHGVACHVEKFLSSVAVGLPETFSPGIDTPPRTPTVAVIVIGEPDEIDAVFLYYGDLSNREALEITQQRRIEWRQDQGSTLDEATAMTREFDVLRAVRTVWPPR